MPVLVRRSEAKRITGGDPFDLPGFGVATLSYENAEGRIWDVRAGAAWAAADVYPIAAWAFKARPEDERRITGEHGQLRAPLKRPVAVRGSA